MTVLPTHTVWGDDLHTPLQEWVANRDADALVFPSRRSGTHIHPSNMDRNMWGYARETAEWKPEWTWHSMRHTFCSTALAKGVPIADVALLAGHQTVATTMTMYVQATGGATQRARNIFGPTATTP